MDGRHTHGGSLDKLLLPAVIGVIALAILLPMLTALINALITLLIILIIAVGVTIAGVITLALFWHYHPPNIRQIRPYAVRGRVIRPTLPREAEPLSIEQSRALRQAMDEYIDRLQAEVRRDDESR
jgi:hypothetical protein